MKGKRGKPPETLSTVADLKFDPKNARVHGDRNMDVITSSMKEFGAARSIVIDEKGVIRAGNGATKGALAAGIKKLRVVDVDGDELVAVRRKGLTEQEWRRLAVIDNRANELSTWDAEMLRELQDGGTNLDGLWDESELTKLLGSEPKAGKTDPDAVPSARATDIEVGDLFQLGKHRLICGDSTHPGTVGTLLGSTKPMLMVTDPPYGVNYDPEWRKRAGVNNSDRMGKVANDDRADWSAAWEQFPGDIAYVWHAGVAGGVVQASLTTATFDVRAQIIWRKPRFVLSRGHYHWQHEPCFYAVRHGRSAHWTGKRNQSTTWTVAPTVHRCHGCGATEIDAIPGELDTTVWEIEQSDGVTGETTHGTQKPVECMARPMRNHAAAVVFEPFSGSGTTIIAGEMQARQVFAIELDPTYVQMAIDRWEAFTGEKAVKLGELPRLVKRRA